MDTITNTFSSSIKPSFHFTTDTKHRGEPKESHIKENLSNLGPDKKESVISVDNDNQPTPKKICC
jgi:hypothetical protein